MAADFPAREVLSVEVRTDGFAIVKTDQTHNKDEMVLSEAALIFLARMLPQVLQKIVASRTTKGMSQQGISPIAAVPVTRVVVNTDLQKSEILLTIVDTFGNETGYAIGLDVARPLSERLTVLANEMKQVRRLLPQ